jgi:hypothetical protein
MRGLLLCVALCCASTSAVADWQNTHWGMTREEATAAVPVEQGEESRCDPVPTTVMRKPLWQLAFETAEGPVAFHACLIGSANSGLGLVQLHAVSDPRSIAALMDYMAKRYGPAKPAGKDEFEWIENGDSTKISIYHYPNSPNNVVLTTMPAKDRR